MSENDESSSSSSSEEERFDEDELFVNTGKHKRNRRQGGKPPMQPLRSGSPRRFDDSRKLLDTSRGLMRLSGSRQRRNSGADSFERLSANSWKESSWDKLYTGGRTTPRRSSKKKSKEKSQKSSLDRFDRLARAKKKTTRRFTKQDDAKNCTFRPKIRKYRSESKQRDEDITEDVRLERFIERQEASKRAADRMIETKRGEKAYKTEQNKRVCRECGATQSYDEVMTKKKFCPCGGKYVRPGARRAGTDRNEDFVETLSRRERERQERLRRLRSKIEREERGGRRQRARQGTFHDTEFLSRMEEDLKKRETRKREAEHYRNSGGGLTTTLRTIRNELRKCESRIHSAASKSASRRRARRNERESPSSPDARMRKLQQQLQAAALMAQELQEDVAHGQDERERGEVSKRSHRHDVRRSRGSHSRRAYERPYRNGSRRTRTDRRRRGK